MMQKVLMLQLFMSLMIGVHAQSSSLAVDKTNFTLSGKIIDKANGEALPYAAVGIKKFNKGTTTNVDGFFTLLNIERDIDTLTIQYVGYQTMEVPIKSVINQSPLIIALKVSEQVLDEVVVMASNLDNQMINASTRVSGLVRMMEFSIFQHELRRR